ncbi:MULTISPECIES: ribonuclease R family protein [Leptolyngbya]|uniref:ribonuclease R family protein n=1 Tax=Leptolyngbya TaxID=47251 RepID=UPI0016884FC9|nr:MULTISPECIES: ribonuclease R family protein [unclassified Leptolyngbya]MBD1859737.1 VacB/RNase II family 3'-5' exoribonuclease [Leptolyngbya sp. FACHB-1624]MCY6491870.1 ribonuclease R [Leptolyngbya sp. GGD]
MEFSIAELLANFTDDKLVAPKALEKKLECHDEPSLRRLQIALDALEKIGVLVKERGKYRRVPEEGVVEGKLRCSSKGFCFAIQDVEGSEDIYIRESQLNHAWNGDRVLVRVTKEGSRRRSPEGEVRLILERANPSVLARIKKSESGEFRAVPLDDRLLFELQVNENGIQLDNAIDHLAHVQVKRYPIGQHAPLGKVAKVLGADDDAADIDIVCCKHDLPREFPETVLAAAKELPTKLTKAELKNRVDLRNLTTLTIKSSDEDSADDAITLEKTKAGGNWRLGIHIADVAHYVGSGAPLDREAQRRGASVYLSELVVPMLPEQITDNLCSLQPGKDRLAVSVLITLDDQGGVLEFEIQPTVINVDYKLSYHQAEEILKDNHTEELKQFEPIFELLAQLDKLSHAIKDQRRQRGAFELNLPEKIYARPDGSESPEETDKFTFSKFHYDDEGVLGAVVVSATLPIHSMIVELMLLANQTVASHLIALGVPSVYRVHPTPDPEEVQELVKLAVSMGIELKLENEEEVRPQDYQNFTHAFAESNAERVLTYLLLSTMKPAFYSSQPKPHFGLSLEQGYTHFTSPVRRYPDLLVHRALHAVFEAGRDRRSSRVKDSVDLRHSSCHGEINWNVLPTDVHQELESHFGAVVVHVSEREKVAQDAENDLEGLKKAELMKERTGEIFHGLITGVQSYGLFVELEELLVEGLVHVSSLKDDWYEFRSRQQTLVGRKNRKQYRLGDRIEVQVKSVDYYRQQIDLIAVGGGSEATDEEFESEERSEFQPEPALPDEEFSEE